jgi:hypothetical protein
MVAEITDAVATLGPDLLTVGGIGIGISAGVFALVKGWSVVRRLVK